MSKLSFITEKNLVIHIRETIKRYGDKLEPFDIQKFNSNIIDPIKLVFDKLVYKSSWDELIENEIFRQRDKSNTNDIGYFHQNIFNYIDNCEVPAHGWDVIFTPKSKIEIYEGKQVSKIYVEMKNKHNTMNSTSSKGTYIRMLDKIAKEQDCACFLVEAIASHSQNIEWKVKVDNEKVENDRIRRVSIDEFYKMVTGEENAFYNLCMQLPEIISKAIEKGKVKTPKDTVMDELKKMCKNKRNDLDFILALYMLGFKSYLGFSDE